MPQQTTWTADTSFGTENQGECELMNSNHSTYSSFNLKLRTYTRTDMVMHQVSRRLRVSEPKIYLKPQPHFPLPSLSHSRPASQPIAVATRT